MGLRSHRVRTHHPYISAVSVHLAEAVRARLAELFANPARQVRNIQQCADQVSPRGDLFRACAWRTPVVLGPGRRGVLGNHTGLA